MFFSYGNKCNHSFQINWPKQGIALTRWGSSQVCTRGLQDILFPVPIALDEE